MCLKCRVLHKVGCHGERHKKYAKQYFENIVAPNAKPFLLLFCGIVNLWIFLILLKILQVFVFIELIVFLSYCLVPDKRKGKNVNVFVKFFITSKG